MKCRKGPQVQAKAGGQDRLRGSEDLYRAKDVNAVGVVAATSL